jgi:hypothetical protein
MSAPAKRQRRSEADRLKPFDWDKASLHATHVLHLRIPPFTPALCALQYKDEHPPKGPFVLPIITPPPARPPASPLPENAPSTGERHERPRQPTPSEPLRQPAMPEAPQEMPQAPSQQQQQEAQQSAPLPPLPAPAPAAAQPAPAGTPTAWGIWPLLQSLAALSNVERGQYMSAYARAPEAQRAQHAELLQMWGALAAGGAAAEGAAAAEAAAAFVRAEVAAAVVAPTAPAQNSS